METYRRFLYIDKKEHNSERFLNWQIAILTQIILKKWK